MEENKIKLSETVMMIDVAYLNFVVNDLKKVFEPMLGRSLQTIDMSALIIYLAMDAGVKEGDNDMQVLLVYDEESKQIKDCVPSNLKEELDGVAFQSFLGEFSFLAVPSEGFVSREELYIDLLQIVLNSAEVKRLVVAPFNEEYGEEVENVLRDFMNNSMNDKALSKEIVHFRMDKPAAPYGCRYEIFGYPLMSSLGIKSEELN